MDADFYDVESLSRMVNLAGVCGKGIFSSVGNVVNYYSREDEVLRDGDGCFHRLDRTYAWYNQETRKGYFPYVADNEAGWDFNPQYDVESPHLELRARVLAHGIPAESFAVGTGEVGNPGLWENVDMTTVPNGGNTPVRPQGHQLWTHSAFIGLPLKDVSRLFKDLNSRMKGQTHE